MSGARGLHDQIVAIENRNERVKNAVGIVTGMISEAMAGDVSASSMQRHLGEAWLLLEMILESLTQNEAALDEAERESSARLNGEAA